MSLNYQLSDIADFKTVCFKDGYMIPTTKALCFLSLSCLYGTITEKNYEEVFQRIRVYERAIGAFHHDEKGPVYITLADVKMHIGLVLNVATETAAKFDKKMMRILRAEAREEMLRQGLFKAETVPA